ncbi:PAS domain-containing protein [Erythrobacter sp. YT30]|uniref:PAS domain-containing protein n=1 Tax=Erythrobacter sp. YT30 TaxID=1735012 RepID=UPI00076C0DD2|nr:PAS domain-containing protein [Erythrobacter sp. YT30]KWV91960.1 histidine kinase [Erythrobacter sp. YT30]
MNTDDERERARLSDQAGMRFDDAPERFKAGGAKTEFSGASGVLFEQAMAQTRMAVCLCDPHQDDMPIVFANRAFRRLTGYAEEEIVGRNCRFLQGPATDPAPVARLRDAIANEDVAVVELLNYRKNGTSFWNALHLGPIYNDEGELVYFFGSQWDVSDVRAARAQEQHAKDMARELSHRMKNMFAVISGIVNVTGRARGVQSEAAEINSRIQALGRAYETTLDEASSGSIDIGQAIRAVLLPYDNNEERLELLGNGVRMPFTVISVIGLILHELAANATKHGAWTNDDGKVTVDWSAGDDQMLTVTWREQGGPQIDEDVISAGTGTAIVDRLLSSGRGSISRQWDKTGLTAKVTVPVRGSI